MDQSRSNRKQQNTTKYEHSDQIVHRRKALFPTEDDSNSDLGPMTPLSDTNSNLSDYFCESIEPDNSTFKHYFSSFRKNVNEYTIIENDSSCVYTNSDIAVHKSTPHSFTDSTSPLYLSPMQTYLNSPILNSAEITNEKVCDTPLRESPTKNLKTPHDTSNLSITLPKLIRKSNLDSSFGDINTDEHDLSPSGSSCKITKLDNSFTKNSKVRTALFPENDISLPVKSFYPKTESVRSERLVKDCIIESKKIKHKPLPMYLCSRRLKTRNRFGQINAGVRHKIRKPKQKKLTKEHMLKAALQILDKSPLNDYIKELNKVNEPPYQRQIKIINGNVGNTLNTWSQMLMNCKNVSLKESTEKENSPPPDPSKKFFKHSRRRGTITVNKNIKLEVDRGKISLLEESKSKCKKMEEIIFDTSDLAMFEDSFQLKENITNILEILNNDKEESGANLPCGNQITLMACNSINNSDNSILLHRSDEILVNKINERKRKIVEGDTSTCSDILLSPTSQMCDMASGLALNSPKRAKLNINKLLDDIPDSTNSFNVFNKVSSTLDMEKQKLFPIFYSSNNEQSKENRSGKSNTNNNPKKWKSLPEDQMLLDAGQKRFGATQCPECEIVYHMGDPGDELMHLNYHNAGNILRFKGWKNENVVANFVNARIIKISSCDPKIWWKKIKDLLEVVNRDLGFYEMDFNIDNSVVFLYIKNKCIVGCIVAEPKSQAFKMLSTAERIDMCSEKSYFIKCGISRIWVSNGHRKEGIGTALMECLRANFIFGYILRKEDIALSAPTELGKLFAINYFKTKNYLIYTS